MTKANKKSVIYRKIPTQKRAIETCNVILDAAAQVLLTEGYSKASTNRIALRAGFSIGTIYEYFQDKGSIFSALQLRWNEQRWEIMHKTVADRVPTSLHQWFCATIAGSIAATRSNPELNTALALHVPYDITYIQRTQMVEEILEYCLAILEEYQDDYRPDNVKLAARLVIYSTHAVVEEMAAIDPESLESPDLQNELIDMMTRYMVAPDVLKRLL